MSLEHRVSSVEREGGAVGNGVVPGRRGGSAPVALPAVDGLADPDAYLARHSRSFQFAASMISRRHRARVARVYAWCRYTDNLADDDATPEMAGHRLDEWLRRSSDAYAGRDSGIELVNRVMGEMAEREIPFAYARDLVRAMQTDVAFKPYADLDALGVYTYRAAGVVGRWLTELHDVREPWMLDRAAALGQAMQLTNILRDVGEDLARGRVYLPLVELRRRGLAAADLDAMRRGCRPIDATYRSLLEDLMAAADADYDRAAEAIPRLPAEFRRATAVAAAVYRGIHGEIRRNGFDNLRRRAFTTPSRKAALAAVALMAVTRARAARRAPG